MLNIRPTTNYFDSGGRNKVHQIIENSNDGRRTKYTKYPKLLTEISEICKQKSTKINTEIF